jgi:hypothetical protein
MKMEKLYPIILSAGILATVVIVKKLFMSKSDWDALFIGGLDTRPNDYDIQKQVELFKNGSDKKVKAYRYNVDINIVKQFLKDNPKTPVYMFSAGCNLAEEISKYTNADVKKIYIIEPYGTSTKTQNIVKNAVTNGVPAKNVIHGCTLSTGKSLVYGSTFSGDCTHWGALTNKGLNPKKK